MASVEVQVERLDRKLTQILAKTERILTRTERRLLRDLEDADGRREVRQFLQLAGGLGNELQAVGLTSLIDDVRRLYRDITREVQNTLRGAKLPSNISRGQILRIESLARSEIGILRARIATYSRNVRARVLRTSFVGQDVEIIEDILIEERERLIRNLETDITNSVEAFRRAVLIKLALDSGATEFSYAGPADGKNRPFCAEHVGSKMSLKQITKLRNDFGGPALTEMGGYNCRHQWRPLLPKKKLER